MKNDINSLKTEVTTIRKDLDSVTDRVDQEHRYIDNIYDEVKGEIFTMGCHIDRLEKKIEQQEQYSRRDNLLFYGVEGDRDESWATTKEKVLKILGDNVKEREWSANDFVRVHRLRTKQAGPQPIIARFLRSDDRFCVLSSRQQLKAIGIGVATDLSPAQRDELYQLKQQGKKGYYKNGKLHIDNQPSNNSVSSRSGSGERSTDSNTGRGYQSRFQFGQGDKRGHPGGSFQHRGDRRDASSDVPSTRSDT